MASRLIIAFFLFCCLATSANAQQVGKFDTVVRFMDTTRKLSCYVPTDYDSTKSYRLLIGLHGLGDNATNYRNALVTSLNWATNFPNTIFIFPEAETINADFYSPVGGESIVDTCIAFAMSRYRVDTSNVILQGFSLGGRAALRYGLEHPQKFEALLLNTPALQGVKNALNQQPTYLYEYENAWRLPVYITHGATDVIYTAPIDTAVKQMILNNGKVILNRIPKVGHTIPTFKQMSNVLQFFETPALAPVDAELVEIEAQERTCDQQISPRLLLRNMGSSVISEFKLEYGVAGGLSTMTVPTLLAPFEHSYVTLNGLALQDGVNPIFARVTQVNGGTDTVTSNNVVRDTLEAVFSSRSLPFSESFSGSFPPPGWTFERSGDYTAGFDIDRETGSDAEGAINAFNTIFIFDNLGKEDAILTPSLDLSTVEKPTLSFDLAFNFHRYTPPYFTDTVDFADTLEILITTNCGDTWQQLFRKGGSELATFAEPITNPLNLEQDFIAPEASDWKRQTIDLSSFATAKAATIKFNYISALGGHLYIDNLRIQGVSAVTKEDHAPRYSIYPNPASALLTIEGLAADGVVRLLDIMGREIITRTSGSSKLTLDVHGLPAGNYVLEIWSDGSPRFEKISIQR